MLYLLFPPKQWESFSSIDPSFAFLPNARSLSALVLLLLSMQSSCQLVTPSFSLLQSYAPFSHSHIPRHVKDPGVSTSTWVVQKWHNYYRDQLKSVHHVG